MEKPRESIPDSIKSPEAVKKQEAWNAVAERIEQTTDGLGKKIEDGIKETVIAFNILGLPTTGSCEGHLQRAIGSPWIDIEPMATSEMETLQKEMGDVYDQIEILEKENLDAVELDEMYEKFHALRKQRERFYLEEMKKAVTLLGEFYKGREVEYDRILIAITWGYRARIQAQGTDLQAIASPEDKERNLVRYQEEMRAFTEFLKNKYFESNG